MLTADPSKVSRRAKTWPAPARHIRSGNHYAEIQALMRYSTAATRWASRRRSGTSLDTGLARTGHQVATDALVAMEHAMARDGIKTNDRQLACARIQSEEGQNYLKAMAAAANYAWVNRSSMTFLCRSAFSKAFNSTPDDLDMQLIYDVSHISQRLKTTW